MAIQEAEHEKCRAPCTVDLKSNAKLPALSVAEEAEF